MGSADPVLKVCPGAWGMLLEPVLGRWGGYAVLPRRCNALVFRPFWVGLEGARMEC